MFILVLTTYLSIHTGQGWVLNERMETPFKTDKIEECLERAASINSRVRSHNLKKFKVQAACVTKERAV